MYLSLALWVKLFKNTTIFAQDVVDIAYKVVVIAVEPIVMDRTAMSSTELLILSPDKLITAFYTFLVSHRSIVFHSR